MALTFEVGMSDGVTPSATSSADAMQKAAVQAGILSKELASVEAAIVKASALGASSAKLEKLTNQHDLLSKSLEKVAPAANAVAASLAHEQAAAEALKRASADKLASDVAASKSLGILRDAFGGAAAGAKEFFSSIASGDAKGALKGLVDTVASAAKVLDAIAPGLGQAAAAIIEIEAAVPLALISGAQKAVEMSEKVRLLTSQFEALGEGAISGAAALDLVEDIANKTGAAKDQVAGLARTFESIGVTNVDALSESLLAARSAIALVGDSGGQAFESLSKKIAAAAEHGAGLKIAEKGLKLIAETGARASDIAAQMGISVAELDAGLKAGSVDASLFGSALQHALIDKGAAPLEAVAHSLGGIKNRFGNAFDKMFEGANADPFLRQLGFLADIFDQNTESGKAMHDVVVMTFDSILDTAAQALPYVRTGFLLAAIAGTELAIVVNEVDDAFASVLDLGVTAAEASADFVSGLVDGITGGIPRIIDAASEAANSALDAVKSTLGIHSPSVVMMNVGMNVAEGMAQGMVANDNVREAAREMGGNAYLGAGAAAAEGGGGESRSVQITNHFGGVHVSGAGKDAAEINEEAMAIAFEKMAAMQGYGPTAA